MRLVPGSTERIHVLRETEIAAAAAVSASKA